MSGFWCSPTSMDYHIVLYIRSDKLSLRSKNECSQIFVHSRDVYEILETQVTVSDIIYVPC